MLFKEDLETIASLLEILYDNYRTVINYIDRLRDILNNNNGYSLADVEYNRMLDCLDFIFDIDDGYAGRLDVVHGGTELLESLREDMADDEDEDEDEDEEDEVEE